MYSLKAKLMVFLWGLGMASAALAVVISYSMTVSGIYREAAQDAETLSDQIAYSLEVLAAQDDIFSMQRVAEKSSTLEGVARIIIVDNQQTIKAHSEKNMVGKRDTSPIFAEALEQHKNVSQTIGTRIIFVRPLRGQAYNSVFQDVIGAVWVEMDISSSVQQTRRSFLWIGIIGAIVLFLTYVTQYLILKNTVIDRILEIETGIKQAMDGKLGATVKVKTSFGSEDEINALAHSYNYLSTSLLDNQTKLKSERDFALQIMESMGEGLTIANEEGILTYINPAYARFLKRSPDEIVGHAPSEFTHANDHKALNQAWRMRKEGAPSSYETNLTARDGSEIRVIISAVPRFINNLFAGSIAVITNVSERAHLEQMKTDFINRASHELRTPLTTAILMANLLEEGGTEEQRREFLVVLQHELNRQRVLLNDLLMAGRIESGLTAYHLAPTDILSLMEEAVASVKPQAESNQIAIETIFEKRLPQAQTDRQALLQVVLNLLSNAIKFSHQENRIIVQAKPAHTGILIAVQDFGIGIPAHDMEHIASRFFRAQNATTNEIQGSGIGLYIVNEIIKGLKGWMKIDSVENQGTTALVWIPCE